MRSLLIAHCTLLIALGAMGCASSQPQSLSRNPVSLNLELDADAAVWHQAAKDVDGSIPSYSIAVSEPGRDLRTFNRIETDAHGTRICLEPHTNFDFGGNLTGFTPLYCAQLDEASASDSLTQAIDKYQSRTVSFETDMTPAQYRAWILSHSSAQDPLCYSVYPSLFAVGTPVPISVEENYLLACANAIEGESSWPQADTSVLAARLRTEAAMLSNQNSFIAASFQAIARDGTREGNIYGLSIEGYTELMAHKLRQSEISTLEALRGSDAANLFNLSKLNAMRLFYIANHADDMTTDRLQAIIETLSPREDWPNAVVDTRRILQLKACQVLAAMPNMTPSLVGSCLPWLRTMTRNTDDFEMALRIVEEGIYGARPKETAIHPDVLSWLRFASLPDELSKLRHVFGQRNANHAQLSEQERAILLGF